MFARVSTIYGMPDRARDAVGTTVPEEIRGLPGFKGAYALVDRNSGKAVLITLWETEEAMRASQEVANRLRGDIARDAGATTQPIVETYEVIAQPETAGMR